MAGWVMETFVSVVCDNTVGRSDFLGEHGWSCLIERGSERYLFDTGQGLTISHNKPKVGSVANSACRTARSARTRWATVCICYFGGDPTPQILHAIKASRLARQRAEGRILRICWETNGAMTEPYLEQMARLSLISGGCIKFDLKAWDDKIHRALCGTTNKKTLEHFKRLTAYTEKRPEPPFLIASTLLVPGYVDVEEVAAIARFIAQLNTDIPYSLLGFYPHFYLDDFPPTSSRSHAFRCKEAAEAAGLRRVHLGNLHVLGDAY
ncbi:MAG: radical SAM protein [Deltaproteobacteria bacterium]|nr:radical SAM protein [Deltaproteobacteria bacterium]